jgi:hypothetical protein
MGFDGDGVGSMIPDDFAHIRKRLAGKAAGLNDGPERKETLGTFPVPTSL